MTKSAEIAEGIEICPRCLLPIESDSGNRCSCDIGQPEQNANAAIDGDEWSVVT